MVGNFLFFELLSFGLLLLLLLHCAVMESCQRRRCSGREKKKSRTQEEECEKWRSISNIRERETDKREREASLRFLLPASGAVLICVPLFLFFFVLTQSSTAWPWDFQCVVDVCLMNEYRSDFFKFKKKKRNESAVGGLK